MLLFVFSSCGSPADDSNYYEVSSGAFPELTFHVKQNANLRILGSCTDDYSEKAFGGYTEQYDIAWTVNETEDNVTVANSDYQIIAEFAGRLEGLLTDYDAAVLYGSFYTISRITVFPKEKWQSYVKGAAIELKASESPFGISTLTAMNITPECRAGNSSCLSAAERPERIRKENRQNISM